MMAIGAATVSGWTNTDIVCLVMKHSIKFTKSTPQHKTLLLVENVSSNVMNKAKEIEWSC